MRLRTSLDLREHLYRAASMRPIAAVTTVGIPGAIADPAGVGDEAAEEEVEEAAWDVVATMNSSTRARRARVVPRTVEEGADDAPSGVATSTVAADDPMVALEVPHLAKMEKETVARWSKERGAPAVVATIGVITVEGAAAEEATVGAAEAVAGEAEAVAVAVGDQGETEMTAEEAEESLRARGETQEHQSRSLRGRRGLRGRRASLRLLHPLLSRPLLPLPLLVMVRPRSKHHIHHTSTLQFGRQTTQNNSL